jgi:hypothetical protein
MNMGIIIPLQAGMFLPLLAFVLLLLTFISIFLLSRVINAALEVARKDHPLKFSPIKAATLVTAFGVLALFVFFVLQDGSG